MVAVHLVFSTKDRRPYLANRTIRKEMHKQLGGTSNTLQCPVLGVCGVEDPIHLLGCMHRSMSRSEWGKELKRVTSIWINLRRGAHRGNDESPSA